MAGLKVGELYATLGLDSTGFNAGLMQAQSGLAGVGDRLSQAGMALTAATASIAALGGAVWATAVKTGEYAEKIQNMSQSTGLGVERLQELKVIAENAGLNFEALANTSSMVQRKLMGVEDDTGKAAEVFKRLGISIYGAGGQLKSMDVLFPELIKKFQGMTNVTERNMLASQVFGRNIGEIAPILGMTTAEFERAAARAKELGLVLDKTALEQAAKFDDAMDDLKQSLLGVVRQAGSEFIPMLRDTVVPLIQTRVIPAIRMFLGILASVIRTFARLPVGLQVVIAGFLGMLAGLGPLLMLFGKAIFLIQGIISIAPALGAAWTVAMGPVGWVIGALVAVGALLTAAYMKSKPFRESVQALWKSLKSLGSQLWESLKKLWTAMQPIVAVVGKLVSMKLSAEFRIIGTVLRVIIWLITQVVQGITALITAVERLLNILQKKPASGGLINSLLDMAIAGTKAAKDQAFASKEAARNAVLAAEEEAQAVLDVITKRREAAAEERKRRAEMIGFGDATDLWRKAMVAGGRAEFALAGAAPAPLTTQNLPGADDLKKIQKDIADTKKVQEELLRVTRERLGTYGA